MLKLLEGIKVVDFTTIVLGPYATQFLGDFGAEVIKVEPFAGDGFRAVRPGPSADIGAGFAAFNRNKRSIVLDLKQPAGQEVLGHLVKDADVVVHNMRGMSALALGIAYEQLRLLKPDLVYCWSPGFASHGPDANSPAYDDIIQARSGVAALNADADNAPQFLRSVVCDKVVGLHLALAIAAAIVHRLRTGEGQSIEVPMLENMTSFLLAEHLAGHTMEPAQGEMGYERMMTANRRPFKTADGYMAIMPYSTKQWIQFLQLVGERSLAGADWVLDAAARSNRIDELYQLIAQVAPRHSNTQWQQQLSTNDIPCAVVNALGDVLADPQLAASGALQTMQDEDLGTLRYLQPGFFAGGPNGSDGSDSKDADTASDPAPRRAPHLGEHGRQILAELGYEAQAIQSLIDAQVVGDY
ncbi:MAG TPA: CoA transferase [Gammaproteobacteria bacterium]|nr:CoA transferase [Gammaproteobacteria bacterium]